MANAKLRYRKIKALRELSNGYPLQSLSTGGLDNETEFILGNQLRQYSETTQASKWGNNTGSH